MDLESENLLKQLDEKLDKLRALGVERGMSASEIDDCILKCVNAENNVNTSKKRKRSSGYSRGRQVCLVASAVCAGFWAFLVGVSILTFVHEPSDDFVARTLQPLLAYPVLRGVRLMGLLILRRYSYSDLAEYHHRKCLVANPFYKPGLPLCYLCESVTSVQRLPYEAFKPIPYEDFTFKQINTDASFHDPAPVVLTGGFKPVGLSTLMDICREHVQEMTEGIHIVRSSSPRINDLTSVLNLTQEEAKANPKFHLLWRTRMVGPSRVLRTIYSRPAFIDHQSEVVLEKTIFIDSPKAESYTVPFSRDAYIWYVQSSGHRRLRLIPKPECTECQSFQITMNPGDILSMTNDPWTITSLPVIEGYDIPPDTSVAFMGMYTTD